MSACIERFFQVGHVRELLYSMSAQVTVYWAFKHLKLTWVNPVIGEQNGEVPDHELHPAERNAVS